MENNKDNKGQTRPQDEGKPQKFVGAVNKGVPDDKKVEGEGSYTASRNYREGVEKTVKSGKVDEKAQEAKRAIDGPEGEELQEAERQGAKGPQKRVEPKTPF